MSTDSKIAKRHKQIFGKPSAAEDIIFCLMLLLGIGGYGLFGIFVALVINGRI